MKRIENIAQERSDIHTCVQRNNRKTANTLWVEDEN